ncbi:hypothetical protein MHI39_11530 [Heyndrickxia sp. FSL K6-6286]|uniref:ATP synthase F0 subunit 8 n=1 Tax=Heyndrickxia oleronia TaxID=38875 RepID=A0AAW6SR35_9BACI|nr:hypothetical protein [Heyndrickxia oleronia]MCM3236662.1 hypothetical protein [Heyndrickxia oleronia]MDH5159690.1 hypothetical protein [Heyndrickxia oleronia]GIN40458.1 hypothetical protein J19TS1_34070 [Heyndrickxia oleronia]
MREYMVMEYLFNLIYDPVICSFYVSILLTIGLAYIWNHFIVNPYSCITTEPTATRITSSQQWLRDCKIIQNNFILWIIKCIRRKESPNEDPDHHLSVTLFLT